MQPIHIHFETWYNHHHWQCGRMESIDLRAERWRFVYRDCCASSIYLVWLIIVPICATAWILAHSIYFPIYLFTDWRDAERWDSGRIHDATTNNGSTAGYFEPATKSSFGIPPRARTQKGGSGTCQTRTISMAQGIEFATPRTRSHQPGHRQRGRCRSWCCGDYHHQRWKW